MSKRADNKYYKDSIKHLNKEMKNLNQLGAVLEEFVNYSRNTVIHLSTFHLIAAAQTLKSGLHIMKKDLQKNINWYKKCLK